MLNQDAHGRTEDNCARKFESADFDEECTALAQYLLGKVLVRKSSDGQLLKGVIVETEAYLGGEDKASHSYNGKITARNRPMYEPPGTSYVYAIYGMYHCMNISSRGAGSAVLIRALEPMENVESMLKNRMASARSKNKSSEKNARIREEDLCRGPSKLCMSFDITKKLNNIFMPASAELWVEHPVLPSSFVIVQCPRIGIDKCGAEWASKNLRFYIFGNECVSKRDKNCEKLCAPSI
ncbi:N-methylpurine-DNA glycosylase [Nesidiocoris tenuis]|uniref:DNA-3-methyladenine glycosylase II n=1 Tax=Nesidiocoris tenuis TaxID=355587 RepID=A0ABN7ACZ4_9HEMI|nr:N-methylpurine-DNA glycosylase [Nesidiocoris tenuis]